MNNEFSLAGLESRLSELLHRGFRFSTDFSDAHSNGLVFLRHDVDLSLTQALEVAKVEAILGVQATYFLLVSSDFYNLASRASKETINAIQDLGHQLGLHFDVSAGPETQVGERLSAEIEMLESITHSSIRFFSQHKPTTYGFMKLNHGSASDVRDQMNVDGSCVTYCSDSAGIWSHGDYLDRMLRPDSDSLQLLLHPIWWASETPKHPFDTLTDFLETTSNLLTHALARNVNRFGKALETGDGTSEWPENIR